MLLFRLDARTARPVVHVHNAAHVAEPRRRGEVANLHWAAAEVAGDNAAEPDSALHFAAGRVVIETADGADRQAERIRRRLDDRDVAGPPDEQRHAAKLFGRSEDRADVS